MSVVDLKFMEFVNDNQIVLCSEKTQRTRRRFIDKLSKKFNNNYAKFYKWYIFKRLFVRALFWLNPKKWKDLNYGHVKSFFLSLHALYKPSS